MIWVKIIKKENIKLVPKKNLQEEVRTKNTTDWKHNKSKQLLNLVEEHTNRAGNLINAKKMGAPCNCRNKCFKRLMRKHVKEYLTNIGV